MRAAASSGISLVQKLHACWCAGSEHLGSTASAILWQLIQDSLLQASRFQVYMATHSLHVWWIVIVTSAVALAYNLVHSEMIKRTSAVTTTVLGEVKIVGLMVLSILLLGAWPYYRMLVMPAGLVRHICWPGCHLLQASAAVPSPDRLCTTGALMCCVCLTAAGCVRKVCVLLANTLTTRVAGSGRIA